MVQVDMDTIDDNDDAAPCYAELVKRPWPGGGTTTVVQIHVGDNCIRLWPAEAFQLEELAKSLLGVAKEIRKGE